MTEHGKTLITTKQLVQKLNLPGRQTVYDMIRAKKIPFVKLGHRTLRFDPAAVDAALGKFEVKAASVAAR